MKSRALRVFLLMLFVGILAGAAYVVWTEEQLGRATASATRAFEEHTRAATRMLLDVRTAQAGYVAAGQGEDFWASRVDALIGSWRDAMTSLQARARTPEAREGIEAAAEALDDFQQMDRRARNYARNGQRLLASDLVFSDGLDKIDGALAALDRARHAERTAGESAGGRHRRAQLLALAGAAAGGLLLMAMLVPVPGGAPTETSAAMRREPQAAPADSLPLQRPAATTSTQTSTPAPAPPEPLAAPIFGSAPPVTPPPPTIDLPGVAALCTDLARVLDIQALPPALERAARLLHASGIVIWITDPDQRELAPVIAHGYPPQVIARMGTIGCGDENVTAAAFRTGLVQIVKANGSESGAIAAPLLTPSGTAGVMAAEVLPDLVSDDQARAAATIVAAQLSTLVGPPAARAVPGTAGTGGG